jgi:hypothetical protein
VVIYLWGHSDGQAGQTPELLGMVFAEQSTPVLSPVKARARDFYALNTEDLGPDEMRLIAGSNCWLTKHSN